MKRKRRAEKDSSNAHLPSPKRRKLGDESDALRNTNKRRERYFSDVVISRRRSEGEEAEEKVKGDLADNPMGMFDLLRKQLRREFFTFVIRAARQCVFRRY